MSGSAQYKAALAAQLGLLVYFELCVLVPLGSWNDQPGRSANLVLGAAIGAPQLLLLMGTVWRVKPLLWLGLIGDSVWLLLHIQGLWVPYLVGASPQYAAMYARVFGRTTKLLPNFGNHLAPDAMHIFIDALVVAVLVTLVGFMRSLRPSAAQPDAL
jgi:hypothetical protein